MRIRSMYKSITWLPPVLLLVTLLYLTNLQGWGAVGGVVFVIPIMILCAVMAVVGLGLFVTQWHRGKVELGLLGDAFLAGSVGILSVVFMNL